MPCVLPVEPVRPLALLLILHTDAWPSPTPEGPSVGEAQGAALQPVLPRVQDRADLAAQLDPIWPQTTTTIGCEVFPDLAVLPAPDHAAAVLAHVAGAGRFYGRSPVVDATRAALAALAARVPAETPRFLVLVTDGASSG